MTSIRKTSGTPSRLKIGNNEIKFENGSWCFFINNVRVACLDENGNLKIRGDIITNEIL